MSTKAKRRGRPAGSKTKQVPTVAVPASRCPHCGSTNRGEYTNRREFDHEGTTPEGAPYNRVVWRRTSCQDCGQSRDDRTFEFSKAAPPRRPKAARAA